MIAFRDHRGVACGDRLAKMLLAGEVHDGSTVVVDVDTSTDVPSGLVLATRG